MEEIEDFYRNCLNIQNEELISFAVTNSKIQTYKKNESIFNGNFNNQESVPFLLEGVVKVYSSSLENNLTSCIFYTPGIPILIHNPLSPENNYKGMHIQSIKTGTKIIHLNLYAMLDAFYLQRPQYLEMNKLIIKYLTFYVEYHCSISRIKSLYSGKERIKMLLTIYPELRDTFFFGVSQEHFASLIGLNRQSFSTSLSKLTEEGYFD